MTISSTTNRNTYTGNGAVDTYSYTFRIFSNTDLLVTVKDTSNVETTLSLTTDYTVTGVGEGSGGTVVLVDSGQAWLDGDGDLLTDYVLTIRRVRPLTQTTDIRNQGDFFPETHEDAFDHGVMIGQQQQDEIDRSIKLSETTDPADFDGELPAAIVGSLSTSIVTNATGDGLAVGPTTTEISNAQGYASAASASASAASTSETNAAASAAAAANSAASVIWNDVVFITNADSPYTITNSQRGKLIACDCTSGAITLTLPEISGLDLDAAFVVGIKKTDNSGNGLTINRSGTDTIDGATSKSINVADAGTALIPDTDPSPDEWTSADFGAIAGNLTVDQFSGDGSTTGFTLSVDPGTENNTWIFVDGVYQEKQAYSVSGTTLTFTSAPPTGSNNIEVMIGTTLTVGTPSDGAVTRAKLATGAVADLNVSTKTTTYTATASDNLLLCDASGGAFTVTLPTAVGITGKAITIKKTDDSTNLVTIDGDGSETIEKEASLYLKGEGQQFKVISDGTNWVLDGFVPYHLEARNTSATDISSEAVLVYDEIAEDLYDVYNESTGDLTIPSSGYYSINVDFLIDEGFAVGNRIVITLDNGGTDFYKNIVELHATPGTDVLINPSISLIKYFEEADVIRVKGLGTGSDIILPSSTYNKLFVQRIA